MTWAEEEQKTRLVRRDMDMLAPLRIDPSPNLPVAVEPRRDNPRSDRSLVWGLVLLNTIFAATVALMITSDVPLWVAGLYTFLIGFHWGMIGKALKDGNT